MDIATDEHLQPSAGVVTAVGGLLVPPVHFGLAEIRRCRQRCRPAGSAPSGAISVRRRSCWEPSCCLPRTDKAFPKAACAAAGAGRRSALSAVCRSPFPDTVRVFSALFMQIPGAFFRGVAGEDCSRLAPCLTPFLAAQTWIPPISVGCWGPRSTALSRAGHCPAFLPPPLSGGTSSCSVCTWLSAQ